MTAREPGVGCAAKLPSAPTILVSKDINLRIKADAPVSWSKTTSPTVFITDLYTGCIELTVSAENGRLPRAGRLALAEERYTFPNEYCTLTEEGNPKRTALTKVDPTGKKLVPIIDVREGVWGIKPRNREQHFAFDALLTTA
jgi:PhoH-like ATPase